MTKCKIKWRRTSKVAKMYRHVQKFLKRYGQLSSYQQYQQQLNNQIKIKLMNEKEWEVNA